MNKQLSVLGNLRVAGAIIVDKDTSEFPTPARLGMFAVKNRSVYIYQEVNGFETWYPLFKNETPAYLHTQAIPALEWTVNHNLDSSILWYEIQNSNGDRIYEASREVVDSNTTKLHFSEAIIGTAIFIGPNNVDLSIVNASVLNVGGAVTIDSSGVKVNGETLLTISNLSTELTPAVNAAVGSALSSLAGAASGLATLGIDGKVPATQLPPMDIPAGILTESDLGSAGGPAVLDNMGKLAISELPTSVVLEELLGAANGVATLGVDQKLSASQLPAIAQSSSALQLTTAHSIAASGDIAWQVSFDGSDDVTAVATLADTGVVAGNHTKVNVDSKGRVIGSSNLAASDIPDLDWAKIKTGKPMTLAGYNIADAIPIAEIGVAGGVASLGGDGKVPASQLPAAVAGGLNFLGTWNATTNNPNIASSIGSTGAFYKVSVAGTTMLDGTSQWELGDLVLFDGSVWNRIDGGSTEVTSVAGRVGAVVLAQADITGLTQASSPTFAAVNAATFTGALAGNAATATKLKTARTIELTGDVTGTGTFDGSGNLAIEATVVGGTGGGGSSSAPYDVSGSIFGIPTDGEYLARVRACRTFVIPADQSNGQAGSNVASTGNSVFTIFKNSISIGTITFGVGSKVGTISVAADVNFAVGDVLSIICPSTADASLAYIDISLVGNTI